MSIMSSSQTGEGWVSVNYCHRVNIYFKLPESKAHMSFFDQNLSFVLGVLLTFHIFFFFSQTTGPQPTKLCAQHYWIKGVQICLNEGPSHLLRENIFEKWLIFFKKSYQKPFGQKSSNLCGSILMHVVYIQVCSNRGPRGYGGATIGGLIFIQEYIEKNFQKKFF